MCVCVWEWLETDEKNSRKILIIVEMMGGSLHYSLNFYMCFELSKRKRDLLLFFVFEMQSVLQKAYSAFSEELLVC